MHFTTRMIIPAAALAVSLGAAPLMAQQQAPAAPEEARESQQAMSLEGELLRVDVEAKHLWVRSAEGEKQFSFNDQTEITGEGRNVEGLATMTGTQVKIEYKAEGTTAVATKIDIQARTEQPAPSSPQPQPQQ